MAIVWSLVWPFIRAEWRFIAGFALIVGLYVFIENRGYKRCETDIQIAKIESLQRAQENMVEKVKSVIDDNIKEHKRSMEIQDKLDEEIKKRQYSDCVVSPNGVRLLNKGNK